MVLVADSPIVARGPVFLPPSRLAVQLIRTNKAVYSEACAVLYAKNDIDLSSSTGPDIAAFLKETGYINASLIRHISIALPLRIRGPRKVQVPVGRHEQDLEKIGRCCTNLAVFTAVIGWRSWYPKGIAD